MATYYKGRIVLKDNIETLDYKDRLAYIHNNTNEIFFFSTLDINNDNLNKLLTYLKNIGYDLFVKDSEIIEILNQIYKIKNNDISFKSGFYHLDIIFEVIKGNDNNLYARELHTKLIFPIYIADAATTLINYKINFVRTNNLSYYYSRYYELIVNRKFNFTSLDKLNAFVKTISICDQNELDEYLNRFSKGLFKEKKKQKFLDELKRLYNKNVFKEGFKLQEEKSKEKVVREKKSLGTSIMENIEYLLLNIKTNNQELYSKFRNKYEELLKNPNLNNQLLAMFEGELEAILLFGNHEVNDILEYLNNLKKEYLTNYLNNSLEKTDITLEKINKINELFLKVKDKYNLLNQRDVLKNLAFLYVMEIYENKEIITLEELENSYFADNLKFIVICIKSLQELGLINCNYLIDIVEELSCKIVFDMIRNIEFNFIQEEQVKELVKSF